MFSARVSCSMTKMILGYWDFRGYGEMCRYILEYCECQYEDKQYERTSTFDKSKWRSVQNDLGLDFPNLPYLIDGEVKITESMAVIKYIARKHGLVLKTGKDIVRADILEGVLLDMRSKFFDGFFCPPGKYGEYVAEMKTTFDTRFKQITDFIGERRWLVTEELTYLDFLFFGLLAKINSLYPSTIGKYPRIQQYMQDFKSIPQIARYLTSGRFEEFPKNDPYVRRENIVKAQN